MRNSKTCPKCRSTDVIRIPGIVGAYGAGNNIGLGATVFGGFAKVTRYLCGGCGFSEEWIDSADDIAKLKKKYAP
jgi:predicted nucleic-acid-binding Zn-ribbon protein